MTEDLQSKIDHLKTQLLTCCYDLEDPLKTLEMYVNFGRTPPHEILIAISERFRDYLDAKGQKSLDQAFNYISKQRVGNPAKQTHQSAERFKQMIYIECMTLREPNISKIEHAENYIARFHSEKLDPDSMVRYTNDTLNDAIDNITFESNNKEQNKAELIEMLDTVFDELFPNQEATPVSPTFPSPEQEKKDLEIYLNYLIESGRQSEIEDLI